MTASSSADERFLERLLLPLLSEQAAREFLHRVAPELMEALEQQVLHAAAKEDARLAARIRKARERVEQARSLEDLEAATDAKVLPSLAPDSRLWDSWQHEGLREELQQAVKKHRQVQSMLASATPGSLTYFQTRDRVQEAERALFDVKKRIALAWLEDKEKDLKERPSSQVDWNVQVRLQIPIVVSDRPIDYIDAEITVTASTPRAFATQTFAVVVIPSNMGIIPALRRINILRHFLPSETALIAVTAREAYIPVLRQHNVYVHLVEEADIAPD